MRLLRPALAFATLLLTNTPCIWAADLLAADRPIAEAVDHYIEQMLARSGPGRPRRPTTPPWSAA